MASTQHPIRGGGPDPKGDSLIAIKEWLIRDPRSAQPEPYSDLSYRAASDRSANLALRDDRRFAEAPTGDCPADQEELDDAPSIAEAVEPSTNLILDERATAATTNADVTQEFVGCRVIQGDEHQETKSAVPKLLLRASACAVLLAVVAVCTFEVLPYLEHRGIFSNQDAGAVFQRFRNASRSVGPSATPGDAQSVPAPDKSSSSMLQRQLDTMSEDLGLMQRAAQNAWTRFRNWSSDESHPVLLKKDIGAVAEHAEPAARSAQPTPTVDRSSFSSEAQHQFDTVRQDLSLVQRTANNVWNRLRDWSSHQVRAVMPGKDIGTSSERSAAAVLGVTPSTISSDVESTTRPQPASQADRPSSSEFQHQLDAMTENLGILQRMVAELTDRQEQITKDIATLQTAQQSVSQKLSTLPRSFVPGTPRKSLHHRAY
jgi:hypothetical protein